MVECKHQAVKLVRSLDDTATSNGRSHINTIAETVNDNSNVDNSVQQEVKADGFLYSLGPADASAMPMHAACIVLKGKVVGVDGSARILLDTGASTSVISKTYVEKHKLTQRKLEKPGTILTANQDKVLITHVAKLSLTIDEYTDEVEFYVFPDMNTCDIILGANWHQHVGAVTDYGNRTIKVKCGSKRVLLHQDAATVARIRAEATISVATLRRIMKSRKQRPQYQLFVAQMLDNSPGQPEEPGSFGEKLRHKMKQMYPKVFKETPDGLPPNREINFKIQTQPNSEPVAQQPYKLSAVANDELKRQIDELLRLGFIRPSQSSWASPVLFVGKKDGSLRMCVDYRALNKITVRNRYPLPRVDELLERLASAKCVTKLDLKGGYNQMLVEESDIEKTAFTTRYGLYEFLVLSFGLCNAPSAFMQLMNTILKSLLDKCVIVFLDDILIYSDSEEQHEEDVRKVMQLLDEQKLYVNTKKCTFGVPEVEFLGHRVGGGKLTMCADKVQAIEEWPELKSVAEVQSFLGLTNYYRKFVYEYSKVAAPLHELTHTNHKFVWGDEQQKAFKELKHRITTAPVLCLPDHNKPWVVYADASGYAVGGVLCQEHDGYHHPVMFVSKKLSGCELNWPVHDKELYAIYYMFKTCKHLLQGRHVTVFTDHKALEWLMTQKHLSAKQYRWSTFMSDNEWRIIYKPGAYNRVADALSRRPDHNDGEVAPDLEVRFGMPVCALHLETDNTIATVNALATTMTVGDELLHRVRTGYQDDDICKHILQVNGTPDFRVVDGMIYKGTRLYIPDIKPLQLELIAEYHNVKTVSHRGIDKTYDLLTRKFYWQHMYTCVKEYIQTCDVCQKSKYDNKHKAGELQQRAMPGRPFVEVTMDFVTKLPVTSEKYDTIMVVVDRFSKFAKFIPLQAQLSSNKTFTMKAAHAFMLHWRLLYGMPKYIISDRDPVFTSAVWSQMMKVDGSHLLYSSSHHAETDGQTERTNRTMEEMLRCYVADDHHSWADYLPYAQYAYNNTPHASTGKAPHELVYGVMLRNQIDLMDLNLNTEEQNTEVVDYITERQNHIEGARKHLERAMARQKAYADRTRRAVNYEEGMYVYVSTEYLQKPNDICSKLKQRYAGPYKILERIGNAAYKLELPPNSRAHPVFHVSKLRKYYPRFIDTQLLDDAPSPVPSVIIDDNVEYEVERILKHRRRGSTLQYLVKWLGYSQWYASWEPASALVNAQEAIAEYKAGKIVPAGVGMEEPEDISERARRRDARDKPQVHRRKSERQSNRSNAARVYMCTLEMVIAD